MAAVLEQTQVPSPQGRLKGGTRWLTGGLSHGLPGAFVAAFAAAVLAGVLYTVASVEPKEPRAYAELTLSRAGCSVVPQYQINTRGCLRVTAGVYRVFFTKPIDDSTVLASRGSCCPGAIGASADSDQSGLVVVERRLAKPVRASVLVP